MQAPTGILVLAINVAKQAAEARVGSQRKRIRLHVCGAGEAIGWMHPGTLPVEPEHQLAVLARGAPNSGV